MHPLCTPPHPGCAPELASCPPAGPLALAVGWVQLMGEASGGGREKRPGYLLFQLLCYRPPTCWTPLHSCSFGPGPVTASLLCPFGVAMAPQSPSWVLLALSTPAPFLQVLPTLRCHCLSQECADTAPEKGHSASGHTQFGEGAASTAKPVNDTDLADVDC